MHANFSDGYSSPPSDRYSSPLTAALIFRPYMTLLSTDDAPAGGSSSADADIADASASSTRIAAARAKVLRGKPPRFVDASHYSFLAAIETNPLVTGSMDHVDETHFQSRQSEKALKRVRMRNDPTVVDEATSIMKIDLPE